MALQTSDFTGRISRSLMLLGSFTDEQKSDIVADATRLMIQRIGAPVINASLSVDGTTREYDMPDSIKRIVDVRNSDNESVTVSVDLVANKIVLNDTPNEEDTLTVYGTPKNIRTNIDTIIASLSEDYAHVLWAFVVAVAHDEANSDYAEMKMRRAIKLCVEAQKGMNRSLNHDNLVILTKDVRGNIIGDSYNPAGVSVDINDLYGSDL